jgi:hypothetical protein
MKRAYVAIRKEPVYRAEAFAVGLRAVGYDVRTGDPQELTPDTVYVTWNRYGQWHETACRVERAGGTVLVAENGYVTPGGGSPHDSSQREWYALAIGGHNGSGRWHIGGPERWAALGVDLKPWRTDGEHVLVAPNRGFGRPDMVMPCDWPQRAADRLRMVTRRPLRVRPHPGNSAPRVPLAEDLRDCWVVVIWSSSVGVQALIAGVPVVCEAPRWICVESSEPDFCLTETPLRVIDDRERLPAMQRMAWAQWSVEEIASGEPFRYLLSSRPVEAQSA